MKKPKLTILKEEKGIQLFKGIKNGTPIYGVKHPGYFDLPIWDIDLVLSRSELLFDRWVKFIENRS